MVGLVANVCNGEMTAGGSRVCFIITSSVENTSVASGMSLIFVSGSSTGDTTGDTTGNGDGDDSMPKWVGIRNSDVDVVGVIRIVLSVESCIPGGCKGSGIFLDFGRGNRTSAGASLLRIRR